MITIEVKGPLNVVTGRRIVLKGKSILTVRDMAKHFMDRYYDSAKEYRLESIISDFFSQNIILVNDVEISALNGADTRIKSGDKITILNFTHGG